MPNVWSHEHSVGVPELDGQHQQLFHIVNELERTIASGRGHAAIETVLASLVRYTIFHFADEEESMQRNGFPGLDAHRIQHNLLTLKISALQKEHETGKPNAAEALMLFLQHWLKEHLLKADKAYAQFLFATGKMG